MNGIILNIIAYGLMTIGAYFALDVSIKRGSKLTKGINFVIMFWNLFMFVYLIKEHKIILDSPLNVQLNFFETITNYLLAFWLISFKISNRNEKNNIQTKPECKP